MQFGKRVQAYIIVTSMVLYFTPFDGEEGKQDYVVYMGRDKFENEDLIKYGLPHDIWYQTLARRLCHIKC